MILCSSDGRLCLNLHPNAIATITAEASKQHPSETGGVLLGYYDPNYRLATVITATPPPPDSQHGRSRFLRGTDGIKELLFQAKRQNPSLFYLGEWHTHPAYTAEASSVDIWQMNCFASKRLYGARSPILLVVGGVPPDNLKWMATIHKSVWKKPVYLKEL